LKQTGNFAVGYKRDLIDKLRALKYVRLIIDIYQMDLDGASPVTQQVRILFV
jgi:hypothetical protein